MGDQSVIHRKCLCIAYLVLSAACVRANATQLVIQETPVLIVTSSSSSIFPQSWLSQDINAIAETLRPSEVARSTKIINKAAAKYPGQILGDNLRAIYVLHRLKYCGISTSGTNSARDIYIANRGKREGFTDDWLESTFHEEFSSILLRNFPQYLDVNSWTKVNPPSFQYGASGVAAVASGQDSQIFSSTFNAEGFLYEYSKATLENDFNSIAAQLFLGNADFWSIVDKHPKIREKTEFVIGFYHKLSPGLSKEFFLRLIPVQTGRTVLKNKGGRDRH